LAAAALSSSSISFTGRRERDRLHKQRAAVGDDVLLHCLLAERRRNQLREHIRIHQNTVTCVPADLNFTLISALICVLHKKERPTHLLAVQ
jgi:hypothetical protein